MVRLIVAVPPNSETIAFSFNSKDGAIDSGSFAELLQAITRVSIPKMVRLIESLQNMILPINRVSIPKMVRLIVRPA